MEIVGNRKFVELPGERLHELPPLLVRTTPNLNRLDRVVNMAADIIESEDMIPAAACASARPGEAEFEAGRRKMDLALNLVDQYRNLMNHWSWGDSIIEWIRQCEITFETRLELRHLLRGDVWPHAGRSSFVTLLEDKAIDHGSIDIEKAVGLRLTFRQPPPIKCFSDQFLFFLNGTVAATAYSTWAQMSPSPVSSLPPERFTFQVVTM